MIQDVLSAVLLAAGGLGVVAGGIGIMRLPDVYSRLHAAGVTDTFGSTLVLAGLAVQAGWSLVTLKLALIWLFLLLTSPVATHALARAALAGGVQPRLDNRADG